MPSMSLESTSTPAHGQRRRLLDDPLAIRALAHPLRIQLQTIVGRAGRITAAAAARELGISQALASHHLRQLAKYGFVEQVEGDDNRARPWRLVSTSHSWRGADKTPEGAAAATVLEQVFAEQALTQFMDWQERRSRWPKAWRDHTGIDQSTVYLTQQEVADLEQSIDELIGHYVRERPLDDLDARPEGSVAVSFTLLAMPLGQPPDGG